MYHVLEFVEEGGDGKVAYSGAWVCVAVAVVAEGRIQVEIFSFVGISPGITVIALLKVIFCSKEISCHARFVFLLAMVVCNVVDYYVNKGASVLNFISFGRA